MDFVSIEDLVIQAGTPRRTIDRKMSALKEADTEKYNELTKKEGKKLLYYAQKLIGYLRNSEKLLPPIDPNKPPKVKPIPIERKIKQLTPKPTRAEKKKAKKEKFRVEVAKVITNDNVVADYLDDAEKQDMKLLSAPDQRNIMMFAAMMQDYETGLYSISDLLIKHAISRFSFYNWVDKKPLFAALYAKSSIKHKRNYNAMLYDLAKDALRKVVTGYDKELYSRTFLERVGPDGNILLVPVERKVQQKHIPANTNAIVLALTNRDPEDWKRMMIPSNAKTEAAPDPMEKLSDDELFQKILDYKNQGLISESGTVLPENGSL